MGGCVLALASIKVTQSIKQFRLPCVWMPWLPIGFRKYGKVTGLLHFAKNTANRQITVWPPISKSGLLTSSLSSKIKGHSNLAKCEHFPTTYAKA
jgi:hypothetical protein